MPIPAQNLSRLQCEPVQDRRNRQSDGDFSNGICGCPPSLPPATGKAEHFIFVDCGHAGPELCDALTATGRSTVQIVRRSDTADGFDVLRSGRVGERTLARRVRCRRLSRDRENSIAHIRRITHHPAGA